MQIPMYHKIFYIGILSLILMFYSSCLSTSEASEQQTDTAEAQEIQKSIQDTVLIFTGSDWSSESGAFIDNVLTEDFYRAAAQVYTVQHIDLPRNTESREAESIKRNYLLFSEYRISEVPYIVMQTKDKDIYVSQPITKDITGSKQLLDHISDLSVHKKRMQDARQKIMNTSGYEKALAIDEFLHIVYNSDAVRYDSLRLEVPLLDPENKSGLRAKYLLITAHMRARNFAQQDNYIAAGDEYKKISESGEITAKELQTAWYLTAYLYSMSGEVENKDIISYLQRAIQADPLSPGVEQIKEAIKKLEKKHK